MIGLKLKGGYHLIASDIWREILSGNLGLSADKFIVLEIQFYLVDTFERSKSLKLVLL